MVRFIVTIVLKKIEFLRKNYRVWKVFPKNKSTEFGTNISLGNIINVNISKRFKKILLGNNVIFKEYCSVTLFQNAELIIEENVFINNYCSINCLGKISIGQGTIIGEAVKIYDHNHSYKQGKDLEVYTNSFVIDAVKIGKNCWIGSNVTILKGVDIGDNVIIGANNLIFKSIKSNSIIKAKIDFIMS